jgi:hypothetical protein
MPFATLFSNVAARLFGAPAAGGADTVEPELVKLAVEAIVDAVDPRLRAISGYERKIGPGVERTIRHMQAIARELPAPVELSRAAWTSDPLLNALFANANDVSVVLGRSDELRSLFETPANAAAAEAYALLGTMKEERSVFAPALVDGAIQQDVAQTTVSFAKHRLFAPAAELIACRREVGVLIFRRLAALALERITALGERATGLEQRKAMLGARLRMLNLRRNGIQDIADGAHDESAEIAAIEREVKATVDDYVETKASLGSLDARFDHINAIFDAHADYVSLARVPLRVDKMGFKVSEAASGPASDLTLSELSLGEGLKIVIAFVRCRRAELPPKESLSARAARDGL